MKKVLAVGDSLIAGDYGESLFDHSKYLEKVDFLNRGQNGEPMRGIVRNLKVHLKTAEMPEILILDGGANDLLIPYMKKHHPKEWGPFFRRLFRHGSTPVETEDELLELLQDAIASAFEAGVKTVIFLTIPCLGENPEHPLNRERERMNRKIRDLHSGYAKEKDLFLGDLGEAFDRELSSLQSPSTWLFSSPSDLEEPCSPQQRRERNLSYTIDGVHLNTAGALLSAGVLDEVLKKVL